MSNQTAPISFLDIKAILYWLVKGKEDNLQNVHGPTFGWGTKEELANVVVDVGRPKTYRLIDPSLVGNGKGAETYLIQALTKGVDGMPRMPFQGNDEGQYATPYQISTIIAWIDAGMPD